MESICRSAVRGQVNLRLAAEKEAYRDSCEVVQGVALALGFALLLGRRLP